MRPMSMMEFFALAVGASVFIRYNKDDDPQYPRFNGVQTVTDIDGDTVYTDEGNEWSKSEVPDFEDNLLDTGRGYAYFFHP